MSGASTLCFQTSYTMFLFAINFSSCHLSYLIVTLMICCWSTIASRYYLIDPNSEESIPSEIQNDTIIYSMTGAWNNIASSINQTMMESNTSDINELVFNISIISGIDINDTNQLILPSNLKFENIPIIINIDCYTTECWIIIHEYGKFIQLDESIAQSSFAIAFNINS